MAQEITISPKGVRWYHTGHLWIYRDDVAQQDVSLCGQIVRVLSPKRQFLGQAFYNAQSKIALRFLTFQDEPITRDLWVKRMTEAAAYRHQVVQETNAYRLIASEADGLPGLIVDRYGEYLSIQMLSLGMDRLKSEIVSILVDLLKPIAIVERDDAAVRRLEGLEEKKAILYGTEPPLVECREGKMKYLADLWNGQKTGAYLDQRENRLHSRRYLGRQILDGFCYAGGFSLHLAKGNPCEIKAVDANAAAIELLKQNITLNQLTNVTPVHANLFDYLKAAHHEQAEFDLIILDPPSFARSRQDINDAARGYKEINLRAMKLLKVGGILITCSCSYNLSEDLFLGILRDAAVDAKRRAILLEKRTQARDHPILLTMPETHYLKCLTLQIG